VYCRACLDQNPSREEEECVVLTQIAIEHAPILRSEDIETVCPTKLCEFGFRERLPLASSLTTSCSNPEDLLKTGPSSLFLLLLFAARPQGLMVSRKPTAPSSSRTHRRVLLICARRRSMVCYFLRAMQTMSLCLSSRQVDSAASLSNPAKRAR
jgi:hypothetical protein